MVVLLGIILVVVFWGFFFGPLRRAFVAGRVAVKQVQRTPGTLVCPECGGSLAADASHAVSHHRCGECSGRWFESSTLAAALAKKNRPMRDWFFEEGGEKLACPKCGERMRRGEFRGESFSVYQCAPCASFWLGRVQWVSLEMRVLG